MILVDERHMACIFAVSDRILSAASDLRTLLEPMAESIASTVVLREPNTKRAIVLLRFATNAAANIFVEVYDGQIFDSVNASTFCHVARVSHVYAVGITGPSQSPSGHENNGPQQWRLLPWARGLVELPRCPVCCERIDSTFKPVLYARNRRRIPTGTSQVRDYSNIYSIRKCLNSLAHLIHHKQYHLHFRHACWPRGDKRVNFVPLNIDLRTLEPTCL